MASHCPRFSATESAETVRITRRCHFLKAIHEFLGFRATGIFQSCGKYGEDLEHVLDPRRFQRSVFVASMRTTSIPNRSQRENGSEAQ